MRLNLFPYLCVSFFAYGSCKSCSGRSCTSDDLANFMQFMPVDAFADVKSGRHVRELQKLLHTAESHHETMEAPAQLASLDHVNVTPHAHVPAALTRFPTESEVDAAATHAIAAASTPMNDVNLAREINILRSVRHENIVQLHEIAQTPQGDPLIVMEFCQASLLELIHSPKHDLSFSEIKYIIRQVLDATGCLHQRGILHRDLATENVLFNLSGEIKVCDFGISRMAFGQDDDLGFISAKGLEPPNMIVSLPYRAIELLLGESKYGPKLDIWSVGCILAEILLCQTGRRIPFFGGSLENPNKNPTMYVEEIFQILGKPTDETWPNLHKLPLLKTYNTGKISSAKAHKEQGDERAFLRRFFRSQEGKPADTKYCLTESFFELLAGLLTLCPDQRMTAAEALQNAFFTKEKPVPEWHAWHWALASAEIPRGDKKAKVDEDETKKLLKQLSKEELGQGDEEKGQHGHKAVLEKWREQAEKRQQEELKRSSSTKSVKAPEDGTTLPTGWTKHWSSSKQRYYYHHSKTGKNSWSIPTK